MAYIVIKTDSVVFATGDEGIKMLNRIIKEDVERIVERTYKEILKIQLSTTNKNKQVSER